MDFRENEGAYRTENSLGQVMGRAVSQPTMAVVPHK
jgi:hypothetical protein